MQSESVVNSGPAIFISPSGPNPMMVQVCLSATGSVSVSADLQAFSYLSTCNSQTHQSGFWGVQC